MTGPLIQIHPRIMVTGLSGVGKSHLIIPLSEFPQVRTYQFGREMQQKTSELMGSQEEGQELSDLTLPDRQAVQRSIIADINIKSEKSPIIIDGHLLVEQGNSSLLVPGIPYERIHELALDGIILVVDTPERIIERRKKSGKIYSESSLDENNIMLYQNLYRNIVATYAALYGCGLSFLDLSQIDVVDDDNWDGPRSILQVKIDEMFKNLECPIRVASPS